MSLPPVLVESITPKPVSTITGTERLLAIDIDTAMITVLEAGALAAARDRIATPLAADNLQALLDTQGYLSIPAGTYNPTNRVLFLDRADQTLSGTGRWRTTLNASVYVGWKRGLIDASHYPGGGYRTKGDSCLVSRGTAFDNGPSTGQWGALTTFTVHVVGSLPAGSWTGKAVTGIVDRAKSTGRDDPAPWYLWCNGSGQLQLEITTSDNVRRVFTAPHPAGTALDWAVTVNFAAATVTAIVNGSAATVTGTLPASKRFVTNDRWGWALGAFKGYGNELGYFGANPLYDATFTTYTYSGSGGFSASLVWTRLPTYAGGDLLPLVAATSSEGTASVFAVLNTQGVGTSSNADIIDLNIAGPVGHPCVEIGTTLGGVRTTRCKITGGTYGVVSSQIAVNYPITITDCDFSYQTISHAYIWTCAQLKISGCVFGSARYRALHLDTCVGTVTDCFINPTTTFREMLLQYGGAVIYTNVAGDDESGTGAPVLRLVPSSAQTGTWGTLARLNQTYFSVDPTTSGPVIDAREPGYTGFVTLDVDDGQRFVGPTTNNAGATNVKIVRNGVVQ